MHNYGHMQYWFCWSCLQLKCHAVFSNFSVVPKIGRQRKEYIPFPFLSCRLAKPPFETSAEPQISWELNIREIVQATTNIIIFCVLPHTYMQWVLVRFSSIDRSDRRYKTVRLLRHFLRFTSLSTVASWVDRLILLRFSITQTAIWGAKTQWVEITAHTETHIH